jgi:methionyl-tRNA formyltransferase
VTQGHLVDTPETDLSPGEIGVSKNVVLVGTSEGAVEIVTVIPQGKNEMKAADWARGARINPGEYFG